MLRKAGLVTLAAAIGAPAGYIHGLHMRPADERAQIVIPLEAITWRHTISVKNGRSRLVIGGPITCEVLEKRHLADAVIWLLTYICVVHILARRDQLRVLGWDKTTSIDTIFDVNPIWPRHPYCGSPAAYGHVWFAIFVLKNYQPTTFELFFRAKNVICLYFSSSIT